MPGRYILTRKLDQLSFSAQLSNSASFSAIAALILLLWLIDWLGRSVDKEGGRARAAKAETALAGSDHIVPAWLTRLHPRYRTPIRSLLGIVLLAVFFAFLASYDAGAAEAFQLFATCAFMC